MRITVIHLPSLSSATHILLTSVISLRLFLLCMTFFGVLGIFNQTFSQQPPIRLCTPDCSDDGWWPGTPDIVIPLPNNPDCKITVKWWYRSNDCFNPWTFDIQVVSASYNVGYNCPPFALPFSEILKIAYEKIMRENYAGLPPNIDNTCHDSYRIVQANCWRTDFVPVFGWSACENNPAGCCMQRYRVCKINGLRKIYRLTGSINTIFPPCQNDFDNANCENMCQVLTVIGDGDEGPPPGGGGAGGKRKVDPLASTTEETIATSTAIPNPASESVAILFTAEKTGDIVIRLYDGTGGEIIKTTNKVENVGQTTINLDIRDISNGVYRYDIAQENAVITAGSFVVVKK